MSPIILIIALDLCLRLVLLAPPPHGTALPASRLYQSSPKKRSGQPTDQPLLYPSTRAITTHPFLAKLKTHRLAHLVLTPPLRLPRRVVRQKLILDIDVKVPPVLLVRSHRNRHLDILARHDR